MKYLFIGLLFFLISCGESPCAKKARENAEAEEAAKVSAVAPIEYAPTTVTVTESIVPNSTRGNPNEAGRYKVSDRVCIINKWSGTINTIVWSKSIEGLLVYTIEYYDGTEFTEKELYDTEFTSGNCSTY